MWWKLWQNGTCVQLSCVFLKFWQSCKRAFRLRFRFLVFSRMMCSCNMVLFVRASVVKAACTPLHARSPSVCACHPRNSSSHTTQAPCLSRRPGWLLYCPAPANFGARRRASSPSALHLPYDMGMHLPVCECCLTKGVSPYACWALLRLAAWPARPPWSFYFKLVVLRERSAGVKLRSLSFGLVWQTGITRCTLHSP